MFKFSALPKRCTSVTAPPCASTRVCPQLALAITQRASGEDPAAVRESLALALSVFRRQ